VIAVVVIAETLLRWLLIGVVGRGSLLGVVVLSVVVLEGIDARWGVAAGLLVTAGVYRWESGVALAFAGFIATTVCGWVWRSSTSDARDWFRHATEAALLTTLTLATARAFYGDIFGIAPFYVGFAQSVQLLLPITLAGIPLVWLVAGQRDRLSWERAETELSPRGKRLVAIIVTLWAVTGYGVSFVFQAIESVPPFVVIQNAGPTAGEVVLMLGTGKFVIVLLGMIAQLAIVALVRDIGWPEFRTDYITGIK